MSYRHGSRRKMLKLARKIQSNGIEWALKSFTRNENDRLRVWADHTPNDRPERDEL